MDELAELKYLKLTRQEKRLAKNMLEDGISIEEVETTIIDDRYMRKYHVIPTSESEG